MAKLPGLDDIAQQITAALGDRAGTEHIAQRLAVALAGEEVDYLDLSGLQVRDQDALRGTLVAVTRTRFLTERIAPDDEGSTVETRPRGALTRIDYQGPDIRWGEATEELPLPEGCFLTVHFADGGSLQLPTDPGNAVSSAQRSLAELLPGLRKDLRA